MGGVFCFRYLFIQLSFFRVAVEAEDYRAGADGGADALLDVAEVEVYLLIGEETLYLACDLLCVCCAFRFSGRIKGVPTSRSRSFRALS